MTDHRNHPRRDIHLPVAFQMGDGPRIEANCRDLSLGGMFIETQHAAPFGATVKVSIRLPGLAVDTVVASVVRWTNAEGMGVQFGMMGARDTHALTELLR